MGVDGGGGVDGENTESGADEPGWDVDPDDESGAAVVATVGRQLKAWREAAGLRACELGAAIGYGEDLIYKVEGGRRIPRPELLDRADEVLRAGGKLAAMKRDVAEARYPKKVRDLAKLEAKAVELACVRQTTICTGCCRRRNTRERCSRCGSPRTEQDEMERVVAARMARRSDLRSIPRSCAQLCPGRGDAAPPRRGQNGVTATARTPPGSGAVAECHDPGDADRPRGARRNAGARSRC